MKLESLIVRLRIKKDNQVSTKVERNHFKESKANAVYHNNKRKLSGQSSNHGIRGVDSKRFKGKYCVYDKPGHHVRNWHKRKGKLLKPT